MNWERDLYPVFKFLMIDFNNKCFRWWFMWNLKVAIFQKNTLPALRIFFCNYCYFHSLHESLEQLTVYIYILLYIYFIVSVNFWWKTNLKINCLPYNGWYPFVDVFIWLSMNVQKQECTKHFKSAYVVWLKMYVLWHAELIILCSIFYSNIIDQ